MRLIPEPAMILLDAGRTMNAIAARLSPPSVALAALYRGARARLIGGAPRLAGAMIAGGEAERVVGDSAADLCFLGACGFWPEFGSSAEDAGEAGAKRAMAQAAARAAVVASASRMDRRGRHRVLASDEIDVLVADAEAPALVPFETAGIEVLHV